MILVDEVKNHQAPAQKENSHTDLSNELSNTLEVEFEVDFHSSINKCADAEAPRITWAAGRP